MVPDDAGAPVRYSVRTSAQARYAHLTVSPRDGVVVVVPRRFDLEQIPAIVEGRAEWIRRAERRIEHERASVGEPRGLDGTELPAVVNLRALGETWSVTYDRDAGGRPTAREAGDAALRVTGPVGEVAAALERWLAARAKAELVPWLDLLAVQHGIEIAGVSIRAQRSRWASCSSAGRVSVNRNLLFLPTELAEHVLLHELCHRREMNHSPGFWRLLESLDPHATTRRREIRSGWKYVPTWAQS